MRFHEAHVSDDGLDDDRGHGVLAPGDLCREIGEIVVARDDAVGAHARRDAAAARVARGVRMRPRRGSAASKWPW